MNDEPATGQPAAVADLLRLPTLELAVALLGWRLVRDDRAGRRVGRIVELEAYIGEDDRASHARFGQTARNAIMYGPPGRAYVYLVYGMHDCLNIVTGPAGSPAALLVRAVEPIAGEAVMRAAVADRRRERQRRPADAAAGLVPASRIASGPGLVCAAFGLDRSLTGRDVFDPASDVHLEPPPAGEPRPAVASGPRVGVAYADEPWASIPWRFAIAGNPAVSRPPLATALSGGLRPTSLG